MHRSRQWPKLAREKIIRCSGASCYFFRLTAVSKMRNKKDLVKGTSHRLQAQLVIGICNGQHPACIVQIPYDARIVFKTILTFLCTMAINYVKVPWQQSATEFPF